MLVDSNTKLSADAMTSLSDAIKLSLGLDEARGDKFELVAVAFNRAALDEEKAAMAAATKQQEADKRYLAMAGAGLFACVCLFGLAGMLLGRNQKRKKKADAEGELTIVVHKPGEEGSETPAVTGGNVDISLPAEPPQAALPQPKTEELLGDARRSANESPAVAARLIQMWLEEDKRK